MPRRGRAKRRAAALLHGSKLPADHVSLWATQGAQPSYTFLVGPFVELDGLVYVRSGVHEGSDQAWMVACPLVPMLAVSVRKQLARDQSKAAAAVFRFGGEPAVRAMLSEIAGVGEIECPSFIGHSTMTLPSWFPRCSHTSVDWSRLCIVDTWRK